MKRNGELGDEDDLKLPVGPISASGSEGGDYEYEGEIWPKETDDGKNTMEKSINSMRPFFNQDPTNPKIHDRVTELFNVKQEYKHLIEKEMKTREDHSKDFCRYVKW